jgi:predicted aspartyl protease
MIFPTVIFPTRIHCHKGIPDLRLRSADHGKRCQRASWHLSRQNSAQRGGCIGKLLVTETATKVMEMSLFKVNVVACNPQREDRVSPPIEVLVDTGAELTWLPAEMLEKIGVQPRRKRTFQTATKQLIEREVGYAILRAEGYETTDEVVFALPTDLNLLGVRTIEGFGVMVDNIAHRFVATTTLVAGATHRSSRR